MNALTRLGEPDQAEPEDQAGELFRKISELTAEAPIPDTISVLSGVLVRELASGVALYGMPEGMPSRVLRIVLRDTLNAIADWRDTPKH